MKTLSVTEPYATIIRNGTKKIETRSWKTNYRGDLLIHASSTRIPVAYRENRELMELVNEDDLNFGKIVCRCKLVDCVRMDDDFIETVKKNRNEYISGFYSPGRYAWILDDITPVESGKVKGKLGLWEYDFEKREMELASGMDEMISLGWTWETFDADFDGCESDSWSRDEKEVCRKVFKYLWEDRQEGEVK